MTKIITLLLVIISVASCLLIVGPAFSSTNRTEDSWVVKAPLQQARGRLGVAVVNDKIYALGGDSGRVFGIIEPYKNIGTSLVLNTTEQYDPVNNSWSYKASMPTPRDYFGTAVYGDKIYCIGGMTTNGTTSVNEVYDTLTGTWETKTAMPLPRKILNAQVINDKIYVIDATSNCSNQVYDPINDSWSLKSSPPRGVFGSTSVVFADKIYLIDAHGYLAIYDTVNDSWSTGGKVVGLDWSTAPSVALTVGISPQIFFFEENSTWAYNPATGNWTAGTPMPMPRAYSGIANINNTFYVVGGVTFPPEGGWGTMDPSAAVEQYIPSTEVVGVSPTPSPSSEMTQNVVVVATSSVVVIVAVAGLMVYLMRRRQKKP